MATPTVADTTPITLHDATGATTTTLAYTVPSGSNLVTVVVLAGAVSVSTITLNGVSMSITQLPAGTYMLGYNVAVLAAPTTGNLVITRGGGNNNFYAYGIFTLQDAAQVSPLDTGYTTSESALSNNFTGSTTTGTANDLVIAGLVKNQTDATTWNTGTNFSTALTSGAVAVFMEIGFLATTAAGLYQPSVSWGTLTQVEMPLIGIKYQAPVTPSGRDGRALPLLGVG